MRCSPYVPACARALVLEAKLCCPPALSTQNYPHACANGIRRSATDVVRVRWRVQATGTSQYRIWPQLRCYSGCAPSLCVLSHPPDYLTDTLRVSIACCLVGGAHFLFGLVDGTPLQNTPWQFVVPIGIIVLYGTGYSLLVSSLRAVGWHQPAQARISNLRRAESASGASDRCANSALPHSSCSLVCHWSSRTRNSSAPPSESSSHCRTLGWCHRTTPRSDSVDSYSMPSAAQKCLPLAATCGMPAGASHADRVHITDCVCARENQKRPNRRARLRR